MNTLYRFIYAPSGFDGNTTSLISSVSMGDDDRLLGGNEHRLDLTKRARMVGNCVDVLCGLFSNGWSVERDFRALDETCGGPHRCEALCQPLSKLCSNDSELSRTHTGTGQKSSTSLSIIRAQ